ncbi:M56 family metallopeptidase [Micromonospora sp. NPDC049523]|uniref:M56 family metallopeptidase n=1 Tax=Micromonospora sp. NPDC049523 TaxID=3155921 RepID=UPI003427D949
MIAALVLLAYATVVATAGRPLLVRATQRTAYPLVAVAGWHMTIVWMLAATATAAALAALHPPGVIAELTLTYAVVASRADAHVPLLVGPAALALLVAVALRWTWVAVACTIGDLIRQRRHLGTVRLVARTDTARGIHVLPADEAAVYCLAGRTPAIVATTGAVRSLTDAQLAAVLDHERCHLRERHHLHIRWSTILARAFPFVPVFTAAQRHVPALLELRADDVAARRHGARSVAEALAVLATARRQGVLNAGGPGAAVRAHRLLGGRAGRERPWRLAVVLLAIATGPLSVLLVPFCW